MKKLLKNTDNVHIIYKSFKVKITFGQISKISKSIGSPSTRASCLYLISAMKSTHIQTLQQVLHTHAYTLHLSRSYTLVTILHGLYNLSRERQIGESANARVISGESLNRNGLCTRSRESIDIYTRIFSTTRLM